VAGVAIAQVSIRWVTGDDEIEATSWEDLGAKIKAQPAKKGASPEAHKMKVLNFLGSQGWEMVSNQQEILSSAGSTLTFKRKVK
jgi:hypothetical protein